MFIKKKKTTVLVLFCIIVLLVFGIGRKQQISIIDRYNPFLPSTTAYAVLPADTANSERIDVYAVDNALSNGDWLKISNDNSQKKKYIAIQHKGSYISRTMIVDDDKALPALIKQQIGNEYHQYSRKIDGPRSANTNIVFPFV
ncbi:hypothetical protein [Fructobacillus americanaquae]|uniref:Uncharacterized protein n=1 Tax=Fructobacillus americanaquae TaxID=2940302 RepID=A0ABY5BZ02_9LACO|nr:hypothetical protein [Fructobacillus americanaquae]USS91466.1 hypothetical protein M3M36_03710 [Fructobacillus americanaquae]